jgi:hypothetical protein
MQGSIFTQSFHIPGTLSANLDIEWKIPFDCQLLHVSWDNSANSNGTITLGNSSTADAYLTTTGIGNNTVVTKSKADFVGGEYPHILKDTVFVIGVDYDGSSGTAAANLTIVLTFAEG